MKKFLAVIAVALGCGCSIPVPSNEAKFGDMSFKFPKDVEITGLEVVKTGTRSFTLKATSWRSINNPQTITSSAEGEVKIINATGNVAANVAGQVAAAVVKGK